MDRQVYSAQDENLFWTGTSTSLSLAFLLLLLISISYMVIRTASKKYISTKNPDKIKKKIQMNKVRLLDVPDAPTWESERLTQS